MIERGVIQIQTPVGPLDCEVEIEQGAGEWVGRLLARPGVVGAAQTIGASREEVLANLTELAQHEHELAVEKELQIYGPTAG